MQTRDEIEAAVCKGVAGCEQDYKGARSQEYPLVPHSREAGNPAIPISTFPMPSAQVKATEVRIIAWFSIPAVQQKTGFPPARE